MALEHLTPEEIRTMSLEEKDKWWLEKVYKGHCPQLNFRSAVTGMILGGVLSLTNLYVGIRTGWTLGVGVTSVVLSFGLFKMFQKMKIGKEMTILENNAMQSIATSAGYMTAPMIASLPAYMLVTGHVIPMYQTYWWIIALSLLGVLFAFPLKRRFINYDQMPFPEGYAAGVVLDSLHSDDGKQGVFKGKLLMIGAGIAALIELLRSEKITKAMKVPFLNIPDYWDNFIYKFWTPTILGTPLKDLTIRLDSSIVMFGMGGLIGTKTAFSLILGGVLDYFILAPIMIKAGVIHGTGFKNISMWALWGGTAMMATSSLYAFFSKPKILVKAFSELFKKKTETVDILKHIELPTKIFVIGIPLVGLVVVWMGHAWFGVHWWLGVIAIPLVFVFTLIAVYSTALTSVTPGSALAKLTQITYSIIAPGNMATNLMTAGITSEVSLNTSNLLSDIKPGYMLGGKPRHQAIGHVLGIFAGAMVAVPVFYLLFNGDISKFTSDVMPMPAAMVWKAVAEVLTKGLGSLHYTVKIAVMIGATLGILFEIIDERMKGKFPISGVGMGLAFVLTFPDILMISLGTFAFWLAQKRIKNPESFSFKALVENRETISAGIIAGGSIIGLIILILEMIVLK